MNNYLKFHVLCLLWIGIYVNSKAQMTTFHKTYQSADIYSSQKVFVDDEGYYVLGRFNWGQDYLFRSFALNGDEISTKVVGFPNAQESLGDVIPTQDGGYIFVGSTFGGDDTNPDGESSCVLKIDGAGNMLWRKAYTLWLPDDTGYVFERAKSIVETDNGGYMIVSHHIHPQYLAGGLINMDIYVRRLDAQGNELAHYIYGDSLMDYPAKIIRTPQNEYIIGGYTQIIRDCNANPNDTNAVDIPFIFKIDGNGNPPIWEIRIDTLGLSGCSQGWIENIVELPDGTFLAKSNMDPDRVLIHFDTNGQVISQKKQVQGLILVPYPNGDWFTLHYSLALFRYDSNFDSIWIKHYGAGTRLKHAARCPDGGLIIVANQNDTLALIKTDCDGNVANPIFCNGLGITNYMETDNIKIYPNPAQDYLTISADKLLQKVAIYNTNGKLLLSDEPKGKYESRYDLSSLAQGLYFLKITLIDGQEMTEKIIIE